MKKKVWENLLYVILVLLILGQIVSKYDFMMGKVLAVITNIFVLVRDFVLHKSTADKVKNSTMSFIACGSLVAGFFA